MEISCRRCHETLREADHYCPACGLPQLMYMAAEAPVVALGSESVPPPLGEMAAVMNGIQWRQALRAAIIFAVPAGVLCFYLPPLDPVLMLGAAAFAVMMYARRVRRARLPMGTGARIGLVTGLLVSWLSSSLFGAALWFNRFSMHQGGEWDSMWQVQVEKSMERNAMFAQMGAASAQSAQVAQSLRAWMLSTEGRAGLALSGVMFIAGFLIVVATIGGVVGARFLTQPRVRV